MTDQDSYFAYLRNALWNTPVPDDAQPSDGMFSIANAQKTRGLIYSAVLAEHPNHPRAAEMEEFIIRTVSTHIRLNQSLAKIVSTLRSNGIEGVLLKGQGVAKYYPNPFLRECGDIDYWVGEENYIKASNIVIELAGEEAASKARFVGKHFCISKGDIHLELHRQPAICKGRNEKMFNDKCLMGLTKDLTDFVFEGTIVHTPSDSFNAFYLFYHILHHLIEKGVGHRQLCDFALFLHRKTDNLDSYYLEDFLGKMGLRKAWEALGTVLVDDIGLPEKEFPLFNAGARRKGRRISKKILRDGNFGTAKSSNKKRPKAYIRGKIFAFRRLIRDFMQSARIFPGMAVRYLARRIKIGTEAVVRHFFGKRP